MKSAAQELRFEDATRFRDLPEGRCPLWDISPRGDVPEGTPSPFPTWLGRVDIPASLER